MDNGFKYQVILGVFALVPSLVLFYAVLSTFYRSSNAYLAISWVPAGLYLAIIMFMGQPVEFDYGFDLNLMLESVYWTSLFQAAIGIVLLGRALAKNEDWIKLAIATLIAGLPLFIDKMI